MTSTTIRQPATAGVSLPARPPRLLALGKLAGLVVAVGCALALVLAATLGVIALVVTGATG